MADQSNSSLAEEVTRLSKEVEDLRSIVLSSQWKFEPKKLRETLGNMFPTARFDGEYDFCMEIDGVRILIMFELEKGQEKQLYSDLDFFVKTYEADAAMVIASESQKPMVKGARHLMMQRVNRRPVLYIDPAHFRSADSLRAFVLMLKDTAKNFYHLWHES
jgi:hypothetical protein